MEGRSTGPKGAATRARVLVAAAESFERRGYHGTGLNQILDDSGAPRGSLYFHFPAGKEQVASEAVELAASELAAWIRAAVGSSGSTVAAVRRVIDGLADRLVASGFEAGCPVATVALEAAATSDPIQRACSAAYRSWESLLVDRLVADGHRPARAVTLATLLLSAIEGALLLSRAHRSRDPLDRLRREIGRLIDEPALAARIAATTRQPRKASQKEHQ